MEVVTCISRFFFFFFFFFFVECAKRFGPCADEYCNLFDGCLNCEPGFCDLTVRSQ